MIRVALVIQWCFFWLGLFLVVLIILDIRYNGQGFNPFDENRFSNEYKTAMNILLVSFVIIESLTVALYLWERFIYAWVVCNTNWLDTMKWWNLRMNEQGQLLYDRLSWQSVIQTEVCTFDGQLDQENRPHGYGQWTDGSFNGECLNGWWEHGIPVGPFTAKETGTGYGFVNMRIIGATVAADPWNKRLWTPELAPLRYGVFSVECSVSGKFFKELPRNGLIIPLVSASATENTLLQCIKSRITLKESPHANLFIRAVNDGIDITGYMPQSNASLNEITIAYNKDSESNTPWKIHGWNPLLSNSQKEAIVLIPGFNCPCGSAAKTLAQLMSLGNFPSYLTPCVFHIPGGQGLTYFQAKDMTANPGIIPGFKQFMADLADAGFINIHILVHSMAARTLMTLSKAFPDIFMPKSNSCSSLHYVQEKRLILATLTLINPDCNIDSFFESHFKTIQNYARLVTLYCNEGDRALILAQLFNREPMLGTQIRKRIVHRTIPAQACTMDVIDSKFLDMNIHLMRHSYYNLNRMLVDDLFDIVVRQWNAQHRNSRLTKVHGNLYTFLAAPNYITN